MKKKLYYIDFAFMEVVAKSANDVAKWLKDFYSNANDCKVIETRVDGWTILEMTFDLDKDGHETDPFQFKVKPSDDTSVKNLWTVENYRDDSVTALKEMVLESKM